MGWIGRTLFVAKEKMTSQLMLLLYPTGYEVPTGKPFPEACISSKETINFLWMWQIDFRCCHCRTPQSLLSKVLYRHVVNT